MIIEAGTTLTLETGEYSDFTYIGPFKVLIDIDQQSVWDNFKKDVKAQWIEYSAESIEYNRNYYQRHGINKEPNKGYWKHPSESDFIAWLTREGYIEDIENCNSWYLGTNYGENWKPQIV